MKGFSRLIAVMLAVGVITYLLTSLIAPRYASYASLYFPQNQNPLGGGLLSSVKGESDSAAMRSLGGALWSPLVASAPGTATGLLTSQTAMRDVVKHMNFTQEWNLSELRAVERLKGRVSTRVDKNGFLVIEAQGDSPEQAVQIIQALQKHLEKRAKELTINVSAKNREFIEKRMKDAESQIGEAQRKLVETMAQSKMANFAEVQNTYLDFRKKLEESRIAADSAQASITETERQFQLLAARSHEYPQNLVALKGLDAGLDDLIRTIQQRRMELQDVQAKFTKQSPEFRDAQRNVRSAESVAQTMLSAQANAAKSGATPQVAKARAELAGLRTTATRFDSLLSRFESDARKSPAQFAAVERAKQEFTQLLEGAGLLRTELEMARIAEARDPSRFEVVDEAFENPEPVYPRRVLLSVFAMMVAGILMLAPWFLARLREETQ